jgi:superoxide dismutase, Cu-Zn family
MKTSLFAMVAIGAVALSACATNDYAAELEGDTAQVLTANTQLRDASGQMMGTATATQSGDSIRVRIEGTSLPAGAHGAHIHMTGQCTPPAFESAGGHWNPTNADHGRDAPAGMHKGDMPNILIGTNGSGTLEYTIPNAWLSGSADAMLDADGTAVVIHAGPDDYRTDPSGNSGARIACGVFTPA